MNASQLRSHFPETAPAVTVEEFFRQLRESELLPVEEVERISAEWRASAGPEAGLKDLAQRLVREKKLTAYQATALYQGKGSGLVLGKYVILDKIGEGGMGMVFQARHRLMERVVALKVLPPEMVKSPDSVKRFQREVRAAAKLEHPHVVNALDADQDKGVHFLVMQFVAGADLSSVVKRQGPLPPEKAVECILQAARGLEYAHSQGVVHRDIKPANLLLARDGTVKILDMGLARIDAEVGAGGQADLTNTGAMMGTVDYMSPEQALNTKNADQRSDIYSLGASLWYLLTGRSLYGGDSLMERLLAHREQPIPSLADPSIAGTSPAGITPALDSVFRKMVAKRPEDRYQSMTEVIADLTACITPGATPLSVSMGPTEETKLSEFLRELEHDGGRRFPRLKPEDTRVAPATISQTLVTSGPESDTATELGDRRGAGASHGSGASPGRGAGASVWTQPRLLIGGSIAAVVLSGLAVWSQTGGSAKRVPESKSSDRLKAATAKQGSAAKTAAAARLEEPGNDPGMALQFEGRSSYVMCDIPLPADKPWTVEAWVRTPEDPQLLHNTPVINFGAKGTTQFFLKAYENRNHPSKAVDWEISGYTPGAKGGKRFIEPLLPNTWYHLAGIVDAQGLDIFVNGKRGPGAKAMLARTVPPSTARIAGAFSDTLPPFTGLIDEVRVSSRIRYTADFTPQRRFTADKDTLVLFHCDEGSGEKLVDASDNERHGRVIGANWVPASAQGSPPEFALDFAYPDPAETGFARVEFPPGLNWRAADPITVEMVVTPRSVPPEDKRISLLWNSGALQLKQYRATWSFVASGTDGRLATAGDPRAFTLGARTHLAAVSSGQQLWLFVDGRMAATTPMTVPLPDKVYASFIAGPHAAGEKRPFDGLIHQVRISRGAKYTHEFQPAKDMQAESDTLALYRFGEGAGDVLKDSSVNNQHGKIVGAKWVRLSEVRTVSADRRAAEWVLSAGGRVTVLSPDEGSKRVVTNPDFLPAGTFDVLGIDLNGETPASREAVTDDGLKNVRGLRSLTHLRLFRLPKITDAGISQLADLPALERLDLLFTPIGDGSAEALASLPALKELILGETRVGDQGLETLCRSLKSLEAIAIGARVSVQGLQYLAEAKHLKQLYNLKSGHLTAEGVLHLKKLPELETLNVVVATDAALRNIAELPQLRSLFLNLCKATPDGLQSLKGLAQLEILGLSDSNQINDSHLTVVSELRSLKQLHLSNTAVTDKGVQTLTVLTNLEKLSLPKTSVTPAAVALLKKSLPKCKVSLVP